MTNRAKPGLKAPPVKPREVVQSRAAPIWSTRPFLFYGLSAVVVALLISLLSGYLYWQSLYSGMPSMPSSSELWRIKRDPAVEFIDRNGDTLAIRGPRYGRAVSLSDLPPHVPRAFIAAEDKRFFEHDGADTQAMIRAMISNAVSGRTVSGASTLTQQLVKNLLLSPEQTLKRKVQEIRLARQLEMQMSKDEILELYLNRVYFGSGFYGLDAASRHYFGKPPENLTLAEASILATLPQAPSRLALFRNMDEAKQRQSYVLQEMISAGFVTRESARIAAEMDIELSPPEPEDPQFGYLLDQAVSDARDLLPNVPEDLIIQLTIDPVFQKAFAETIDARLAEESETEGAGQAAGVILQANGEIRALYGGRDYTENQFNRVLQARRQPGSAFKPFVYAAALEFGLSPYDVREDEPIKIDDWSPQNFSRTYLGPVTLNEALRKSLNTVAASLGQELTEERIISLVRKFGIKASMEPLPSIALGSQELTLMELTRAYGPFMTGGMRVDPYLVSRITTSRGEVLYERAEYEPAQVFARRNAETMTAMLAAVVQSGTGTAAQVEGVQLAGKTGTSQSFRDAWFVGYSSEFLVGIWTGNDDDAPMNEVTGGGLPARLFSDVMTLAHADRPSRRLRGADQLIQLNPDQERRVAFYRGLSQSFAQADSANPLTD